MTMFIFRQLNNKIKSVIPFLIHLVSSVNKLMTQHAVDIQNLEKKFQENMKKMEKELEQKLQKQRDVVKNLEKTHNDEIAKQNKEIQSLISELQKQQEDMKRRSVRKKWKNKTKI